MTGIGATSGHIGSRPAAGRPAARIWLIMKLTASTGSTRSRAHGRVYAYLSLTSSHVAPLAVFEHEMPM